MRTYHEIFNQMRVTPCFSSRLSITARLFSLHAKINVRARYVRICRFAPGKLISGYCCGIIVFAFHLNCLHICLHPSFSFRLTRLQIQLAIRPPFYGVYLPSSFLSSSFLLCLPRRRISYGSRMLLIVYLNCISIFRCGASIIINIKDVRLFQENILYFLNYFYFVRRDIIIAL